MNLDLFNCNCTETCNNKITTVVKYNAKDMSLENSQKARCLYLRLRTII